MILDLRELLKNRFFAVFVIWLAIAFVLYFFRSYGADLVLIIAAFVLSDLITPLFVRGGRRIFVIPILDRSKTQPKGYAFIAFFLSIITVTILVNIIMALLISSVSTLFFDIIMDLVIGLILSGLVYIDMNARFYAR